MMLAAYLVLIFLLQKPVEASRERERPYCENTASKCCEAQNEKFHVLDEKLESQNKKLEALNEKSEAQNKKLEALNEKSEAQNETLRVLYEKSEAQYEKLEAVNEKSEAINEKLEAQKEILEDLNEKFETLIKQKQEEENNCKLELDGEWKEAIMVNYNSPADISVWGSSKCTLRVLAVGGGGG